MALNRRWQMADGRWQIQVMRSQRKFARPEQTLTLQMNTDKKYPKRGFFAVGARTRGDKAERCGRKAEPRLQNLCSSVSICGFGLLGCAQTK
jgi:hypothetical protein